MVSETLFPDFTPFDITTITDITIHGLKYINPTTKQPPLLLLHGFPQTHHMWNSVAPSLTQLYTVILMDLRGYGQSSKPYVTSDTNHSLYSKSAMATDCIAVMSSLFPDRQFNILAHDRGARVAHKLAVDYPSKVKKLMLLDICPTLTMFEKTNKDFARAYWHWFFLTQSSPFPESLISANPSLFAKKFFGSGGYTGDSTTFFNSTAMSEYVGQLEDEGAVHAMCEDYRAAAGIDCEEARVDKREGRKVVCDIRVLWGKNGVVWKMFDTVSEWKAVSEGKVTGAAVDSGHYVAEEQPDVVITHVREFFV